MAYAKIAVRKEKESYDWWGVILLNDATESPVVLFDSGVHEECVAAARAWVDRLKHIEAEVEVEGEE